MYYYNVNRDGLIAKNIVIIDNDKLNNVRNDIIYNCSLIEHYKYRSSSSPDEVYKSNMFNFSYKEIKIGNSRYSTTKYLYEYDEYIYPKEVYLIDRILNNDEEALEELFDILDSTDKKENPNSFSLLLEEARHEFTSLLENVYRGNVSFDKGNDRLELLKTRIRELERKVLLNSSVKSSSEYYYSLKNSFTFKEISSMKLEEFNNFMLFFSNDNTSIDKNTIRIKKKINKCDK